MKYFMYILIFTVFCCFPVQIKAAQSIYITQVQISGGPGNPNQDFIELFNPSNVPFNLKGYRLVKRSQEAKTDADIKSWNKDVFIPPHSFFLWANINFISDSVKPDVTSSATIS